VSGPTEYGPRLSKAQGIELAKRFRLDGDLAAKRELVAGHLRLVSWVLSSYSLNGNRDDLEQEGRIALIRAAERFDPDKGFAFSTYAAKAVRRAINRALYSKISPATTSLDAERTTDGGTLHDVLAAPPPEVEEDKGPPAAAPRAEPKGMCNWDGTPDNPWPHGRPKRSDAKFCKQPARCKNQWHLHKRELEGRADRSYDGFELDEFGRGASLQDLQQLAKRRAKQARVIDLLSHGEVGSPEIARLMQTNGIRKVTPWRSASWRVRADDLDGAVIEYLDGYAGHADDDGGGEGTALNPELGGVSK
jgi:RNA polymerase sigma factor (sigma-70 family)